MAMLEAVEELLKNGFIPERTIFLAFGHDEEIGGQNGAEPIAEYFKSEGISFEYAIDEGLMITDGMIPNVSKPVALIGIAEKGYTSIRITSYNVCYTKLLRFIKKKAYYKSRFLLKNILEEIY